MGLVLAGQNTMAGRLGLARGLCAILASRRHFGQIEECFFSLVF